MKLTKVTNLFRISFSILIILIFVLTILLHFKIVRPATSTQKVISNTSVPQTNSIPAILEPGLPIRLVISKIGVDAPIEAVGLTSTGNLDVPQKVQDSAWYQAGSKPGEMGSAVIDGHLDSLNGQPGVFIHLNRLKVNDQIMVTDINGLTTKFSVTKIKSYLANEHPKEVFQSNTGTHLNLITCTGAWNKGQKQYSKRLVVFSDKVD